MPTGIPDDLLEALVVLRMSRDPPTRWFVIDGNEQRTVRFAHASSDR